MCWTPAIIPMQSREGCTIFVNTIDFMVSPVVEQVYSSTFKFCQLKNTRNLSPYALFLPLNAPKCVWWPGSARTLWGSLALFQRP